MMLWCCLKTSGHWSYYVVMHCCKSLFQSQNFFFFHLYFFIPEYVAVMSPQQIPPAELLRIVRWKDWNSTNMDVSLGRRSEDWFSNPRNPVMEVETQPAHVDHGRVLRRNTATEHRLYRKHHASPTKNLAVQFKSKRWRQWRVCSLNIGPEASPGLSLLV